MGKKQYELSPNHAHYTLIAALEFHSVAWLNTA